MILYRHRSAPDAGSRHPAGGALGDALNRQQLVKPDIVDDGHGDIIACFYDLSLNLWITDEWEQAFLRALAFLEHKLGADRCALYLHLPGFQAPKLVCSDGMPAPLRAELENWLGRESFDTRRAGFQAFAMPLKSGRLNWVIVPEEQAGGNRKRLVEEFARELARVLLVVNKVFRVRRQDLYEERAAISRELHDSLAQSLTYLKIQISRLEASLKESLKDAGRPREKTEAIVKELRSRLNRAYRELRELMTTFRLTMHGKSFNTALEELIRESEHSSTIAFTLDNRLEEDCLSVDQEMQLFQIIREALFNIVQHSMARVTVIKLDMAGGGDVHLRISDDGVGPDQLRARARHHGLLIMQERAFGLAGQFNVTHNDRGGTTIDVRFEAHARGRKPPNPQVSESLS
jgi:nitrate/nitrite-specific signal transduction histidine kinase